MKHVPKKELSVHAKKLLKRLHEGHFYPCHDPKTPNSMQELIDAGLVERAGRVETWRACWVPKGFIPATPEIYPQETGVSPEETAEDQPSPPPPDSTGSGPISVT